MQGGGGTHRKCQRHVVSTLHHEAEIIVRIRAGDGLDHAGEAGGVRSRPPGTLQKDRAHLVDEHRLNLVFLHKGPLPGAEAARCFKLGGGRRAPGQDAGKRERIPSPKTLLERYTSPELRAP